MRPFPILAKFGLAALVSVPGLALPQGAGASNVDRVQLAVVDSGGVSCPRDATLTAWAHTSGPGVVRFVIHNSGGGKTGELQANAVAGAAGTYLATYSHTFKVTTDVDIKYRAEAVGSGQNSNWVSFEATCSPRARAGTSATGSGAQPPARAPESRARESMGKPTAGGGAPPARTPESRAKESMGEATAGGSAPPANTGSESKPNSQATPGGASKPNSSGSKPNTGAGAKQCGSGISVTRVGALTKVGGMETAHFTWRAAVAQKYPNNWSTWDNAQERSLGCKRSGLLWNCTASARPCEP